VLPAVLLRVLTFPCLKEKVNREKNNVEGTLPFEMVFLHNLERISIVNEYLKGSIPHEWSSMTALRKSENEVAINLYLAPTFCFNYSTSTGQVMFRDNSLTGTFPEFLFGEDNVLEVLHLGENQMMGTVMPFNSSTLKDLWIHDNGFTGQIPSAFGRLQNLSKFPPNRDLLAFVLNHGRCLRAFS